MKQILYLLSLLLFFAGCKKKDDNERIRFAKLEFKNATAVKQFVYIIHDGKKNRTNEEFTTLLGAKNFTIIKANGEKLIDTTLTVITGHQTYYVIQPDTTKMAVLSTTAPPVPPDPSIPPVKDPFSGVAAAPEGSVKIKLKNSTTNALPYNEMDVVMNMITYDADNKMISTPIFTFASIRFGFPRNFLLVKRGSNANGLPVKTYRFSFINKETGEPVKNAKGEIYETATVVLGLKAFNLFILELNDLEVTDDIRKEGAIVVEGKSYLVTAKISDQK